MISLLIFTTQPSLISREIDSAKEGKSSAIVSIKLDNLDISLPVFYKGDSFLDEPFFNILRHLAHNMQFKLFGVI